MIERSDSAHMIAPAESTEPIEKTDSADPIDPIDSTEPTEPMDSTDPFDPMHRNESCDLIDHLEPSGMGPSCRLRAAIGRDTWLGIQMGMGTSARAWEEAARSLGLDATPRVRPNPLRWLWYCLWGRLPDRHRIWVLYDTTCATWVVRHIGRILVIVAPPVAAIAIFLPGPGELRATTAFVSGACAVLFTAVWANEGTEQRLLQAGWRYGTGPALRERRSTIAQRSGRRRRAGQ